MRAQPKGRCVSICAVLFALATPVASAAIDNSLRHAIEQTLYGWKRSGAGYASENPRQRLSVQFGDGKTRLAHPGGRVTFELRGHGYGRPLRSPGAARVSVSGNRIEYNRPGLQEWYVNGADGVEQGFTLERRPGRAGKAEPLIIALGVSGELQPRLSPEGDAVLLESGYGTVLRYGGLKAWDARGRQLATRLQVGTGEIRLVVQDGGAEYPLVVDPAWTQQAELVASDGNPSDWFGTSVALSGTTAVVGAPYHRVGKNAQQGAAYVFVQNGGTWSQQAELTASDGVFLDWFGSSVALSGTTAVVGAPHHSVGPNLQQGAAYVFVQNGSTWTQQAELSASDATGGDRFGVTVAVSGATAVVGAPQHQVGWTGGQGSAYVFVQNGGTWIQQAELTSPDGLDPFAVSVAVSGATVVVGAPRHTDRTNQQGAAYVFVQNGATWSPQAELTASDATGNDRFGISVAVSGTTAVVGAGAHQVGSNTYQGAAYVFGQNGGNWSQQAELTASDGTANDRFGTSVAVSGATVVVGASFHPVGSRGKLGAAYIDSTQVSTAVPGTHRRRTVIGQPFPTVGRHKR